MLFPCKRRPRPEKSVFLRALRPRGLSIDARAGGWGCPALPHSASSPLEDAPLLRAAADRDGMPVGHAAPVDTDSGTSKVMLLCRYLGELKIFARPKPAASKRNQSLYLLALLTIDTSMP
nr:hypothetical protein CFP56_63354 [Quercus suber]